MKSLMTVLGLLVLAGCDQQHMLDQFSSPQDQAATRYYIDQLVHRNFDPIEAVADETIKGPGLRPTLEQMAAQIPAETPLSVKLVGAQTLKNYGNSPGTIVNTTFEYQFSKTWLLINVALQKKTDAQTIVGFHVVPMSESLETQNAFSLAGKSTAQYLMLAATVTALVLSLYALVACIRTPWPGRKWPWIVFILLGIGKLSINWTTSQMDIQPLSIQLFSAGAFAPLYSPWTLSVSLPLGAILFLMRRRSLARQAAEQE